MPSIRCQNWKMMLQEPTNTLYWLRWVVKCSSMLACKPKAFSRRLLASITCNRVLNA